MKEFLKRQYRQRREEKVNNAIRGTDIHYNLAIEFEESAFGKETSIKVSRLETCQHCHGIGGTDFDICPDCHGTGQLSIFDEKIFSHWDIFNHFNSITTCRRCNGKGKIIKTPCEHCHGSGKINVTRELAINIPKGIADGMKIKVRGGGNAGDNGGEYGSLFVHITVKPNAIFRRKGSNIYCEMKISFIQAALGTTIDVPTLEGDVVKLDIPAGTQYDDVFKLSGKGFHNLRSNSRGDEFVIIKLITPKNLSNHQKKLLQKFESAVDNAHQSEKKSLFHYIKDFCHNIFSRVKMNCESE